MQNGGGQSRTTTGKTMPGVQNSQSPALFCLFACGRFSGKNKPLSQNGFFFSRQKKEGKGD